MPVVKEVVLSQFCPGCMVEDGSENPLRNQLGVFGTYCADAAGGKKHTYSDTEELKEEIERIKKLIKTKKQEQQEPYDPRTSKPADEVPAESGPPSIVEDMSVHLTDVDCYRLSELLGSPVLSAGDLVGAVYALKTDLSELRGVADRRTLQQQVPRDSAIHGHPVELSQRHDGGLSLQVYIPEQQCKTLIERAVFNGQTPYTYTQALLEWQMDGQFFPCDVADYPVPLAHDGMWLAVNIPEAYTGAVIDKAQTLEISPTEYLQNFVYHLIDLELFP